MTNIQVVRAKVKNKRDELDEEELTLKKMYDDIANDICPFNIGDKIEYEPGKMGVVDEIFILSKSWIPLEEQDPENWAVTGRKTNKNGEFGKKNYQIISNKTHIINGLSCHKKTLSETFGIR
jgi:hypothetical protein